jgi:LPXTG-motif cell wall-anchored protein
MNGKSTTSKIALTMFCAGALSFGMAPAAMAAQHPAASALASSQVPGVSVTGTGSNGDSHSGTFHVVNRLNEPINIKLVGVWEHSGGSAHARAHVDGEMVNLPAGSEWSGTFDAPRPENGMIGEDGKPINGQGGYHMDDADEWHLVVMDSHNHQLGEIVMAPSGTINVHEDTPTVAPDRLDEKFQPQFVQPNAPEVLEGTSIAPVEPVQAKPELGPTGGRSTVPQQVLPPQQTPSKVVVGHAPYTLTDVSDEYTAEHPSQQIPPAPTPQATPSAPLIAPTLPATALTPATVSVPATALTPATTVSITVEVPSPAEAPARPESAKPSRSKARTEVKAATASNDTTEHLAHTGADETAALAALALALMGTGITLVGFKRRQTA